MDIGTVTAAMQSSKVGNLKINSRKEGRELSIANTSKMNRGEKNPSQKDGIPVEALEDHEASR